MSSTVHQLRKEKKLTQAWIEARALTEKEPGNRQYQLELAWVYYDFLKNEAEKGEVNNFFRVCQKLSTIQLEENDKILHEQLSWIFFKMAKHLIDNHNNNFNVFLELTYWYDTIVGFNHPSLPQSLFIKTLLQTKSMEGPFFKLLPWLENNILRPEDFQHESYNNNKIMPLSERIFYAYIKSLLGNINNNHEDLLNYLTDFVETTEKDPQKLKYQFTDYYLAEAYRLLSNEQKASSYATRFVKQNPTKSWAWTLLAKVNSDHNKKISYLAKAILLEKKEPFLLNTRKLLTYELLDRDYQLAARQNIDIMIKTRNKNNWPIPSLLKNFQNESWYKNPSDQNQLVSIIASEAQNAIKLLYPKTVKKAAMITGQQGKILHLFTIDGKELNYKTTQIYTAGQWVELFLCDSDVLDIKKTTSPGDINGNIRKYKGSLTRHSNFGFADGVFIAPFLMTKLPHDIPLICEGIAIYAVDKKKKKKGWKAITVNVINN